MGSEPPKRSRQARIDGPAPREVVRRCAKHGDVWFVLEGRGYYRCKKCRGQRVAQWRRDTRRRLVEEAGERCSLCGYDRCIGALTFHHLDPAEKSFGLSYRGLTRPLEVLRAETRKCVLLCANCHAEVEGGVTTLPCAASNPGKDRGGDALEVDEHIM